MINIEKSYFQQYRIPALGFLCDGAGKHTHPSKIKAIVNWSPPKTGKQVSSFLGAAGWNRDHMPGYAWASKPLDEMRTSRKVVWTPKLQASFDKIKALMIKSVSLVAEDPTKEVLLGTDASNLGLGFWRGQAKDQFRNIPSKDLQMNQIEIVQYGSVALPPNSLRHASVTKREVAAVIFAFKKCWNSLIPKRFTLFTDHQALVWLFSKKHTSPMLHRWMDIFLSLQFDVVHWKGKSNFLADALSRPSAIRAPEDITINNLDLVSEKAAFLRDKKIPTSQEDKDNLIKKAHSLGHYGVQYVFLAIWKKGFWWSGIRNDIKRILGRCA